MRALKIAGATIGAVIVVIALLAVIGIPSGYLTSAIKERVERETGYRLAINGATRIGIWPSLNLTLNDIALQDPKDREINNRLTAASIQADVTLASLWSGRPQVTELLIVRPVLNLPLQRVRQANPPPRATSTGAGAANATIEHVSITGGTVVFSNLRDRVENRIETINADATIGSDRKIVLSGSARAVERPLKFEIKATAPPPPLERQNVPAEFVIDAPGLLQAPVSGRAEAAAQRIRRDDQWPVRHARRRHVQRLGLGRYRQQAIGEARSRFPALDDGDQPRGAPARPRSRGAMPRSISTGSIMSTRRRKSPQPRSQSATAGSRRRRSRPRSQMAS